VINKGCLWTKTLRDLSNPDKHPALTTAQRETSADIGPLTEPTTTEGTSARKFAASIATFVALDNGRSALSTLEKLCDEVDRMLTSFTADSNLRPC
jgi:hypothetical protein